MDPMAAGIALARYVLIGFSLLSVAILVERLLELGRQSRGEKNAYERLLAAASKGDIASVHATVLDSPHAPIARVIQQGMGSFGAGAERLRDATGRGIAVQTAALQKNLTLLATIASTAPYVGLFGTVLGILEAFRRIAATGQTGPAIVSGSIAEALIATALGLGVAIPAAIAYNLLLARVNSFSLILENHSLEVAEALADHAPEVRPELKEKAL